MYRENAPSYIAAYAAVAANPVPTPHESARAYVTHRKQEQTDACHADELSDETWTHMGTADAYKDFHTIHQPENARAFWSAVTWELTTS